MKYTKFLLYTLIFLSLCTNLKAQEKKAPTVISKVNGLTYQYYESTNKNPIASLSYAEEAFSYYDQMESNTIKFTLASNYATALYINGKYSQAISILEIIDPEQLEESKKALYFTIRGLTENDLSNFTEAENHFSKALRLYRALGDRDNEFAILNNLGLLYNNIGDYKTSLEYYLSCYEIIRDLEVKIDRYKYYMNIGTVNFNLNNFEGSLESFNEALHEANRKSDSLRIFKSHEKIAQTYVNLNDFNAAIIHYKSALLGYENLGLNKEICTVLIKLGDVYSLTGKTQQQFNSYNRALNLAEAHNFTKERYQASFQLGQYFQEIKNNEKAKAIYKTIIDQENQIVNHEIIRDTYNGLYQIEKTNNPLLALKYLEQFLAYESSIKEKQALTQNEQIKTKYDLKQKEYELENLKVNYRINELELENKNQKIEGLILFAVLIAVLLILILSSLFQKRKSEKVLALKNEEINIQNKKLLQTNTEIKASRKELTELNKIKDQLLSVIAHDVKSPMTDLYNLLFILRNNMDALSKQELVKNLAIIESSTSNILNLLNNILNWIISQSSGFKVKTSRFSLNEIIENNINLVESSRVAKDLNITFAKNDKVDLITSDHDIVDFTLRNLLSNAVKFTKDNGNIIIKITQHSNDDILVRIEDSGVGFNEETHTLLKQNNDRVPSAVGTNTEKGYGIGLSLGKRMLAKIDSKITYKKNAPTGSVFTLHLKSTSQK